MKAHVHITEELINNPETLEIIEAYGYKLSNKRLSNIHLNVYVFDIEGGDITDTGEHIILFTKHDNGHITAKSKKV